MPSVLRQVDTDAVVELVYTDTETKELKQYRVLTKSQLRQLIEHAERELKVCKDMLYLLENPV